jgi:hypothetical protein
MARHRWRQIIPSVPALSTWLDIQAHLIRCEKTPDLSRKVSGKKEAGAAGDYPARE